MKLPPLHNLLVLFVLIIFVAIPLSSFGQKRHEWGLMVGPEYSKMIYPQDEAITSTPKLGLPLQGHVQWQLNTHLSLDLGFGYGLKRYSVTSHNHRGWSPEPTTLNTKLAYHGVDIPVLLKYYFRSNKAGVYAGIGINPALSIVTVFEYDRNISDTGFGDPLRSSYYDPYIRIAPQVAFGIRHPLDEQLDFNVELYGSMYPERFSRGNNIFMVSSGIRLGLWL